ncbi:DUF916 and DUF3324 domain-containing protein [Lacticaseibacillus baoqingensis]|uniref:DUF916 and DUF3324 domain-containing protein n=1 Tax=Lacticaseibacillus baoqingensis TaxID=2486013 RepID=A0ABW4E6I6_9LACO|nr:DUF916 and DUF3324 domain-containing protein [Lacticaseibacillus baoqingensis]
MRKWWLILFLVWWWRPLPVSAAGAAITVTPQLTANQLGGNLGYFNLLVTPGRQQALTVVIANRSDQPQRLKAQLTDAYTQTNGQIGYDPQTPPKQKGLVRLTKIGSPPVTLTIQPRQARTVSFHVTPPASGFDGQLLGAIYVQQEPGKEKTADSGLVIVEQFAMIVAVQLQTSSTLVAPKLKLASVELGPQQIVARIENSAPRLFGGLTLKNQVRAEATGQTIMQTTSKALAMAPNSVLAEQLPLKQTLAPGRYQVVITAQAGQYHWQLQQSLLVPEAAKKKLPPIQAKAFANWRIIAMGIVLIGSLIWGYRVLRQRR